MIFIFLNSSWSSSSLSILYISLYITQNSFISAMLINSELLINFFVSRYAFQSNFIFWTQYNLWDNDIFFEFWSSRFLISLSKIVSIYHFHETFVCDFLWWMIDKIIDAMTSCLFLNICKILGIYIKEIIKELMKWNWKRNRKYKINK